MKSACTGWQGVQRKGLISFFGGSRDGQRNLWCELFLQGWEQFTKKKRTSSVGFERRVWANTSWESLVGSGHLQWEDNRETTLAWKEGWKRRLRGFNRPDREAFSWDRQVWERGCYNSVNDMEDGPWLDTLRKNEYSPIFSVGYVCQGRSTFYW